MRFTGMKITARVWAVAAGMVLLAACMKSPEEQYTAYMDSGTSYVEAEDYANATLQFRNAARVNPNVAEPQYQLAKTDIQEKKVREAFLAIQEAVKIDPNHTDSNLLMAQLLSRLGNQEEVQDAEGRLATVLESRPNDPEALFAMAVARGRLGSLEDAEGLLEKVLENSPAHLQSAVTLARLRLRENDPAGAEKILRDAVDSSEDKKPAQIALTQLLISIRKVDEAAAEVDSILANDDAYGPALLARGLLYLQAGDRAAAEAIYKRASALPGEPYKTAYARVLALNGKNAEATAEFQRLFDEAPADRQIRTMTILSNLREGKVDGAENILTGAIAENDRDFDARMQRSELYLRSGRTELARADIDIALSIQPTSAQAHYLLAKAHEASQNPIGARQELGESMRLDPRFVLARLDMAQSLLKSNSRRSALDILNEAPDEIKNHPQLVSGKIWALIALGDYNDAMNELTSARTTLGERRDFRLQEGVINAARGDHAKALPLLRSSLDANPLDLRAFNALVASQVSAKQVDRALETVRQHANSNRDSAALQLSAGTWLVRGGKVDEARTYLERAAADGQTESQAQLLLSSLDQQSGNEQGAIRRLEGIIAKQSNNTGALVRLAMLQEKQEKFSDAERNYRAVLAVESDNVAVLNNLAYLVATKNGSLDEALRLAQAARERAADGSPATGMVEDTLGWVHYLRGSHEVAVSTLRGASEKAPKVAVIRYHLAMAQAKAGRLQDAKASYQAGISLDSTLPEADSAAELVR
ncbi:MAG: tetratricopeptide repeat protein [Acidobacteria bacterium]|nr:tetratricopeptide repeat protein [Acidobacteriota bacterium]